MVAILRITEDDYESAVDVAHALLHSGGVFVYPTDTVYGLGGDATSEKVVEKIHRIKRIEKKRPMSVMMADFGMIDEYCETGLWEDMILRKYLPGPYTFVLKKRRELPATDSEKLGVRIPDNAFCQALCLEFGGPIITTSANITSRAPPTRLEEVEKEIIDSVDVVIDGGVTKYRTPSLVIDLVEGKILREGKSESISIIELPAR